MFGMVRFVLFSVLILAMMALIYIRRTVGEPFVISKQKLEDISNSVPMRSLKKKGETYIRKEIDHDKR
jgi:hypothetical protein